MTARRTVLYAALGTLVVTSPLFLVGALTPQLVAELGIGRKTIGLAVSGYIGCQALLSPTLGGLSDRIGACRSMRAGALITLSAALLLAIAVTTPISLVLVMVFAGIANALTQPAASGLLATSIGHAKQGIAFGVFQSGKPAGALLAGLAVPAVALTLGWRYAFGAIAVVALATIALFTGCDSSQSVPEQTETSRPDFRLTWVAQAVVASALLFGTVSIFSTFVVDSAVEAGISAGGAGLLLAAASGVSIATRLAVGSLADRVTRWRDNLLVGMVLAGALGGILLVPARPIPFVIGTVCIAATAWGTHGMFYLVMTGLHPQHPGGMAGMMMSSGSVGGLLGPLVAGWVVDSYSYSAVWTLVSCLLGCSSLLFRVAIRGASRHASQTDI